MVSAGWSIETGTTDPLVMEFTRQVVDFGEFLNKAPDSEFNSAVAVTCASIAAAVMAFMF